MKIFCADKDATQAAGRALGALVQASDFVLLIGDLGAGKTTFTQGVAVGIGISSLVQSPTFLLVAEYIGARVALFHADVYRLKNETELWSLAIHERFAEGVWLVEWGEQWPDFWPEDRIEIRIDTEEYAGQEGRSIAVLARGTRSAELLAAWEQITT